MTALSILHDSRRGANHLKLSAHVLDLYGLLSELRCETLYLFLLLRDRCLLLRDRCLQLLNFVVEHGLVLGLGAHARLRYATIRHIRCPTTLVRAKIIPKMVVCKVQSNLNNGGAVNRLEVVEDTTDVALLGIAPREVTDADRTAFLSHAGTNELADVSVIEASGQILSCLITHDCVLTTSSVIKHRRSANCRVEIGFAASSRVIIPEREITNGGILSRNDIFFERGIAHGVVTESGCVSVERKGADSVIK